MTVGRVTSVAHVLWSGTTGGIERLVADLATHQVANGLRITTAFGRADGAFVHTSRQAGAQIADLGLASGYDLRPNRLHRGAQILRDADVIHMHGFNPALGSIVIASRRPVVYTEHGNFALGREPARRELVKRRMQRTFLRHRVARVAANSRYTAQRLAEMYKVEPSSIAVVHNGTETPLHVEARSGDEQLRVVCLGRLVAFKRVDRALEGLRQAKRRDEITLDVVGSGPLEPSLKSLTASLGVAKHVRFLGDRRDVHQILAGSDVILQASQGEPFGLAILEGCVRGSLPIVFADGGGALEVLSPDGIVVGDIGELSRTLDVLVGSPLIQQSARERRAEWTRAHFSISSTASAYRKLYEEAAKGR